MRSVLTEQYVVAVPRDSLLFLSDLDLAGPTPPANLGAAVASVQYANLTGSGILQAMTLYKKTPVDQSIDMV